MKAKNLEKLVSKARKGDQTAFAEIYTLFIKSVYFLGLKMTQNEHDANDIVQETMLKLYESLPNLKSSYALGSFINKTAYNCAINLLRMKDRYCGFDNEILEDSEVFVTEEVDFIPQEYVENQQLRTELLGCIDQLNTEQKASIIMFYFEGLSVRQIADATQVSESLVKTRLSRARQRLKENINVNLVKGGFVATMTTTALGKILTIEADAAVTAKVCVANWQSLAGSLNLPANLVTQTTTIVAQGSSISSQAFVAASSVAKMGVAAKILAVTALSSAVIGTGIAYQVNSEPNYNHNNGSSVINSLEQQDDVEKAPAIASPHEVAGDSSNQVAGGPASKESTDNVSSPDNLEDAFAGSIPSEQSSDIIEKLEKAENVYTDVEVGKTGVILPGVPVETSILRYPKGRVVSPEQIIRDTSPIGFELDKLSLQYYELIDFSKAQEYGIYLHSEDKRAHGATALIIIIENNMEGS